jgi:hypothetical protein
LDPVLTIVPAMSDDTQEGKVHYCSALYSSLGGSFSLSAVSAIVFDQTW